MEKILLRLDIEHQHLVETIENVVFLPNRHFSLNFMLQSYPTSDHGDHVENWHAATERPQKPDAKPIQGTWANVYWLIGAAIAILKNMKVNGKDYPIYYGK